MSTLPKSRLRIAGDLFRFNLLSDILRPFETNQYEEQTALTPRFRAGDALQVEVAIFNDGTLLTDLSPISRLTLTIKPLAPETSADAAAAGNNAGIAEQRGPASNVAPILLKSLTSGSFNTSLTNAQWETKAADKAHAIITLDSESSALAPGERWLALIAESTDGQTRTLAAGPVRILGGGATFNALPQPIVKDLRDQAATSALQAEQSAVSATAAKNLAHAAAANSEEQATESAAQATLAQQSATQAGTHVSAALAAAQQALQARTDAEQSAAQAAQTATQIGDLSSALTQAGKHAAQANISAEKAQAGAASAQAYAASLNPFGMVRLGGIGLDGTSGSASINSVLTLSSGAYTIALAIAGQPAVYPSQIIGKSDDNAGWAILADSDHSITFVARQAIGAEYLRLTYAFSYAEAWQHIALVIDLTQPSPLVACYVNAQPVTAITTSGPIGTYADNAAAALSIGSNNGTGSYARLRFANLQIANHALSAAELTTLVASGGKMVPAIANHHKYPYVYRNQCENLDGLLNAASFATINTVDFKTGSGSIEFTGNGAQNFSANNLRFNDALNTFNPLEQITVKVWIKRTGGSANSLLMFRDAFSATSSAYCASYSVADTNWHEVTLHLQRNPERYAFGLWLSGTNAITWLLDDLRIIGSGCVLDLPLNDGAGSQCLDLSGNESHALLSVNGCTHLQPKRQFAYAFTRISSGFIGDEDRPLLPENAVIDDILWEDKKTQRTTASLGYNAANAAVHVASWTPPAARAKATQQIQSAGIADRRLYLAMSSNPGAVTIHIRGRLL